MSENSTEKYFLSVLLCLYVLFSLTVFRVSVNFWTLRWRLFLNGSMKGFLICVFVAGINWIHDLCRPTNFDQQRSIVTLECWEPQFQIFLILQGYTTFLRITFSATGRLFLLNLTAILDGVPKRTLVRFSFSLPYCRWEQGCVIPLRGQQ